MTDLKFKVNNKAEVLYNDETYACDVQDIKKGYLALSIPIKDGKYLPLSKGERIDVYYFEDNCIYEFTTVVAARQKSNIPLLWIVIPKRYKRIQRRKFVRVPVLINAKFTIVERDLIINKDNITNFKFFEGTIVDLSGGGVRLKTKQDIEYGSYLFIVLFLNGNVMPIKGRTMRVDVDELKNKTYGIKFIDLNLKEQDKIIKNVFKIMREQMKKGLKEE